MITNPNRRDCAFSSICDGKLLNPEWDKAAFEHFLFLEGIINDFGLLPPFDQDEDWQQCTGYEDDYDTTGNTFIYYIFTPAALSDLQNRYSERVAPSTTTYIPLGVSKSIRFTSEAAAKLINPKWNKHHFNLFLIKERIVDSDLQLFPPYNDSSDWEEVYHYYDQQIGIGCMIFLISAEAVSKLQELYYQRYGKKERD